MSEPCQSLGTSNTPIPLKSDEPIYYGDDSLSSHKRTETTLVKNTIQSYGFVSALDNIYQESLQNQQDYSESEVSGGIPEKVWCPACMKVKGVTVRYVVPEISVWRRILCNDCFRTQDCEALHCCVTCKLVITKVKYTAKNN